MAGLAQQSCAPCNADDAVRLTDEEAGRFWLETPMWEMVTEDGITRLRRNFEFASYPEAVAFTHHVARLADTANHHPTLTLTYRNVAVEWYTHSVRGLHKNDFIMAAKTDEAYLEGVDASRRKSVVGEASEQSFPASDPPGWIGNSQEDESHSVDMPQR